MRRRVLVWLFAEREPVRPPPRIIPITVIAICGGYALLIERLPLDVVRVVFWVALVALLFMLFRGRTDTGSRND